MKAIKAQRYASALLEGVGEAMALLEERGDMRIMLNSLGAFSIRTECALMYMAQGT